MPVGLSDTGCLTDAETRFMVRNDGGWDYFTCEWNDEGSTLLRDWIALLQSCP